MISFKIDWFDLLAFQVTLKSLLQHHSSKASSQDEALARYSVSREGRDLGVAFQAPPGSQASSRGEAKDVWM